MAQSIDQRDFRANRFRNGIILLCILSLILMTILSYYVYDIYQTQLPSFEQLHNIEPSLKTKVYDRNGILLKEFYTENRVLNRSRTCPPTSSKYCWLRKIMSSTITGA